MKYDIVKLAEEYTQYLSMQTFSTKAQKTNLPKKAYNDLEYLDAISNIMHDYDNIEDIYLYENFLKGE